MRLVKHFEKISHMQMVSDLCLTICAWFFSYTLRFYSGIFEVSQGIEAVTRFSLPLLPLTFCYFTSFFALGAYQKRFQPLRSWQEYLLCTKMHFFAFSFFVTLNYFIFDHRYSRISLGLFFILNPIFLGFGRSLTRKAARGLLFKSSRMSEQVAVVVGEGPLVQRIRQLVSARSDWRIRVSHDLTVKQTDILNELLKTDAVDLVFFISQGVPTADMQSLFQKLSTTTADVYLIPYTGEENHLAPQAFQVDGVPLVALNLSQLDATGKVLKRLFDVGFALVFLILFSPVFLLCALAVRLSSPGPIFYTQERMGLDGKTFQCLKFRGMVQDAEVRSGGPVWAQENDNRVTTVGKWLRKTSLDEIPQFINVLKGDMSVVGPRPERPVFVNEFRNQIPGYMLRHKVKAGITGWAQINGWRGNTSLSKRIECDLWYIQNWSLWLDMKICLLTPLKGFVHPHAY